MEKKRTPDCPEAPPDREPPAPITEPDSPPPIEEPPSPKKRIARADVRQDLSETS